MPLPHPARTAADADANCVTRLSAQTLDFQLVYCHCTYMTEAKADRLQLRIDEAAKRRLEEAAAVAHLSMSAFVLKAASDRADEVLAERALIPLSTSAAAAFAEALAAPAQLNERLAAALDRPMKVQWLD